MARNKRTPKQQMKYWRVYGPGWRSIRVRARTARVAARIYARGSLMRDAAFVLYELDNPFGPAWELDDIFKSHGEHIRDYARRYRDSRIVVVRD